MIKRNEYLTYPRRLLFYWNAGKSVYQGRRSRGGGDGTRLPSIYFKGGLSPRKKNKKFKKIVYQILTKICNTLLGTGGPKSARLDKNKKKQKIFSPSSYTRIISFIIYSTSKYCKTVWTNILLVFIL